MPYKHLPINFITTLSEYFKAFRELGTTNSEILYFREGTKTEEWFFEYLDKDTDHGFYFKVDQFTFRESDQTVFCMAEFIPSDRQKIAPAKFNSRIQDVTSHFRGWIALINIYNSLHLNSNDKIEKYYANLYYADFEIIDDDADSVPFDLEQQLFIEEFAISCLEILERNPDGNEELIQAAAEIRDTVQNSTKKQIVQKISRFFAKVAQKSLPLLKEFAIEARKTIWKKVTEFGMKEIYDLLHHGFKFLE